MTDTFDPHFDIFPSHDITFFKSVRLFRRFSLCGGLQGVYSYCDCLFVDRFIFQGIFLSAFAWSLFEHLSTTCETLSSFHLGVCPSFVHFLTKQGCFFALCRRACVSSMMTTGGPTGCSTPTPKPTIRHRIISRLHSEAFRARGGRTRAGIGSSKMFLKSSTILVRATAATATEVVAAAEASTIFFEDASKQRLASFLSGFFNCCPHGFSQFVSV